MSLQRVRIAAQHTSHSDAASAAFPAPGILQPAAP